MLLLGHAGITLGAAVIINGILTKRCYRNAKPKEISNQVACPVAKPSSGNRSLTSSSSWFTRLSNRIDIRLLLLGSLIPDIIDKPIGIYFFQSIFSNGRIYGHTLLFLFLITTVGLFLQRRYHSIWVITIAFGTLWHLILDAMWLQPETLLWPLLGVSFPQYDLSNWMNRILNILLANPQTYTLNFWVVFISEILGGVVLAWFMWRLIRNHTVLSFIRKG